MHGNGNGGLESTTFHRDHEIRVVTTYLGSDDLTEIVVYVRPPNGSECVVTRIPHHTANHNRADLMGHDIGRYWVDERASGATS